ncbi:hypothetical protein VTH82DRAFT_4174 [Thermothelomyces myriococcoides]
MKAIAALVLSLAGAVAAQDGLNLPTCAQTCAGSLLSSSIGDCGRGDVKCICSNKSFLSDIACCLADDCSPQDQERAVDAARDLCSGFGVTDLPDEVTCSSASSSAASSSATGASTTASSSGSGTTPTPTGDADEDAAPSSTTIPDAGARPTVHAGLALGGIIAAAALL